MKRVIFAVAVTMFLSACGPSAEQIALDRQNARTSQDLAKRQALDDLKRAREQARIAGAKFASDAKLIRKYQCDTRAAAERLGQVPGYRQFAEEMQQPFQDGCVREAGVILRNLNLAAEKAAKDKAAKKVRLAAKGAKKK